MSEQAESHSASSEGSKIPDFFIIADHEELSYLLGAAGLTGSAIHQLREMNSGSKITQKQFASFRAVFPPTAMAVSLADDLRLYGLQRYWNDAENLLKRSKEFGRYLPIVDEDLPVKNLSEESKEWAGSFMPVRDLQDASTEVNGIPFRELQGSDGHKRTRS